MASCSNVTGSDIMRGGGVTDGDWTTENKVELFELCEEFTVVFSTVFSCITDKLFESAAFRNNLSVLLSRPWGKSSGELLLRKGRFGVDENGKLLELDSSGDRTNSSVPWDSWAKVS